MENHISKINSLKSKKDLISYISNISIDEISNIIVLANDKYHNDESIISDKFFDIIHDYYVKNTNIDIGVGSKLRDTDKSVELPYYMGSLDKIKKDNIKDLEKWKGKNVCKQYLIMDKLDGVSCMLITDEKGDVSLFTRGNGKIGKDITYVKEYINFLPKRLRPNLAFRGELVMSKENFQKLDCEKVNARNTVSGCINSKTLRDALNYVDLVIYEDLKSDNFLSSLDIINRNRLKCVTYKLVEDIDENILSENLKSFREKCEYEIDGIVILSTEKIIRVSDKNPIYAFAYKEDTYINCEVLEVLWEESRYGVLKPRIRIEPVYLSGATITYISAHNAQYIKDNRIGKGSIVEISRSGEVIPYIAGVIKQSEQGDLPKNISYKWNDTGVDIISVDQTSEVKIKKILHFMTTIEAKHISIETVRKMYNAGYTTIKKILDMNIENFLEIDGFKQKLAERTYSSIHNSLNGINMEVLMCASSCFGYGIGVKNLLLLLESIPDMISRYDNIKMQNINKLFEDSDHKNSLIEEINKIEGYSDIRSKKIVNGIPKFINFFRLIKDYIKINSQKVKVIKDNNQELNGKKVCISGFRGIIDKKVEELGGSIVSSISGKTFCLVVKDKGEKTSKIDSAKEKNIPIYTIEEFSERYF